MTQWPITGHVLITNKVCKVLLMPLVHQNGQNQNFIFDSPERAKCQTGVQLHFKVKLCSNAIKCMLFDS